MANGTIPSSLKRDDQVIHGSPLNDLIVPDDPQDYIVVKQIACTCEDWDDFWDVINEAFGGNW
jgi:hypothetical protein